MKRNVVIGTTFLALLGALTVTQGWLEQRAEAQARGQVQAPRFEVDPTFPKPLPNNWYQGQTIGLWVDAQDHVWIVHRPDVLDDLEGAGDRKTGECCSQAPPVLEFDPNGNLLRNWGGQDGPGWQWPASNHGLVTDNRGNIWIGGNGGSQDGHVLKFTQDGKFVMQVGVKKQGLGPDSLAQDRFYMVADLFFYQPANEMFLADGYGNRRVAVIDAESGKMKRFWGAYGNKPDDKAAAEQGPYDPTVTYAQYRGPVHCADVSNDGFVYVCDRTSNRIQVFKVDGTYVKEVYTQRDSRGDGTTWDTAFSRDPQQRFLYVADGANEHVYVVDRNSLEVVSQFGTGGRAPGQFRGVHSIAVDSQGNIYTTETYTGKRLQRFVYKGMGAPQRGVPWPTR
jgi:DNA-binding beta-propeller fold protein YncE